MKLIKNWIPDCDECGKAVESAVQLGSIPSYEDCAFVVCRSCLEQAIRLIDGATSAVKPLVTSAIAPNTK
jgi:hypothetical protein